MAARVSSLVRAFGVALAAHGALLAVALRGEPPQKPDAEVVSSPVAASQLVDIEISPSIVIADERLLVLPETATSGHASRATSPSSSVGQRAAFSTSSRSRQETVDPLFPVIAPQASDASDDAFELPSLSPAQLGLEGPNRLSLRSADPARGTSGERRASDEHRHAAVGVMRSMRQLANEHDRKLGLGAGGGVATALRKAAYESRDVPDGGATFEIFVRDGLVCSIRLVSEGLEKAKAWNEVAEAALERLSGRRVQLPAGGRGLVMHVRVESRAALPSGHDPGLEISVGPFVVQHGRGSRSARLEFSSAIQLSSVIDLPGAMGGGHLSAPGAAMTIVRTNIDPVDVGAQDRQVVQAYTLDETLLD